MGGDCNRYCAFGGGSNCFTDYLCHFLFPFSFVRVSVQILSLSIARDTRSQVRTSQRNVLAYCISGISFQWSFYIMSLSSINAPMTEVIIIMLVKAAMMATSLIIQITFLIVFSFVLLLLFVMLLLYHNSSCLSTPIAQDYTSNRNNPVRYWSSVHMFYLIAG